MKKKGFTWPAMVFVVCGVLFATQATAQENKPLPKIPEPTVTWCLYVNTAPNTVRAFGFDILYPTDILTFTESAKGELLEKGFGYFGVNELKPGRIRVGGMEPGPHNIPQGATGRLAALTFIRKKEAAPSFTIIMVRDHMQTWSVSTGEPGQQANLSLSECGTR